MKRPTAPEFLGRAARHAALALLALAGAGCVSPGGGASTEASATAAQAMRNDSSRYIVLAVDNPLENPAGRAGSSLGSYAPPTRYVLGSRAAAALASLAHEHGLREAAGWPIAALGWHCVVYELPAGRSRDALLATLAHDPRVRLVQPLQDFDTRGSTSAPEPGPSRNEGPLPGSAIPLYYNDPYVDLQRGFVDTGAAQAHRLSTGAGVRIAVVDTGAALDHPDLLGRVAAQHDLVGDSAGPAGRTADADRHGTAVAGVIAAVGNNGEGIVGIAPQAQLEIFCACWPRGAAGGPANTGGARCNSFTLAKALAAVLATQARIVNLSLGGPRDPLLDRLLAELLRQGRIVVGALPPDGRRGGFPTGTPGVIAAGVAGEIDPAAADVLAAPGRDVLTLQPGGRYDYASGSSIAAAHVTGVAALLLAADPRLDRATLGAALLEHGSGPARLNASAALASIETRRAARR
ncbi:S8 family serine peptidase [Ideonella sp.]|uniref:S8 family serine peptidase n=1 Tax=Ideonella sp. TaxID=1929293 RepID=UPI002B49442A|nr:S8 family serine peptidase [Ideonella sp.]HJV70691.1 S8 family serine peptidase [Ideonella sp.]